MKHFDLIVIGGGAAGLSCAVGAAGLGLDVVLVEKEKRLGGDCLWTGCVPSKSLIHSAKVASVLDNADHYGFSGVKYKTDFKRVMGRVWDVIHSIERNDSVETVEGKGVKTLFGNASFVSSKVIDVDGKRYSAKKFVIATGSRAFVPPIDGIEKVDYLTNEDVFLLKKQPKSLIVAGGGPIGVEMAQAFSRLGTEVIIVHSGTHLLDREDEDAAKELQKLLVNEGIKVVCNSRVIAAEKKGAKTVVVVKNKKTNRKARITGDKLLIATGRQRNVEGLGLEVAGISYDRGGIQVDTLMRTSQKHIYAAGDVSACPLMFTHVAEYHAGIIVGHMCFKLRRHTDYSKIPWVTYTDPELARVGKTQAECDASGIAAKTYRLDFHDVDRAEAEGEDHGFVKVTCDKKGKLLGVTILGPHAGELLGEATLALQQGVSLATLSQTVHAYPTLARALKKVSGQFMRDQLKSKPWIKKVVKLLF